MVGTVGLTTLLICRDHPGRGRGAGLLGRGARDLQMVSGREAHAADRDPVAGLGVRRDRRGAGAELADRQLQLALCFRRARRGRPVVGRGLVFLGKEGPLVDTAAAGGVRRAQDSLLAASDVAHLHRLRRRDLRRLLGAVAGADLVHLLHRAGARLLAAAGGLHLDPALDLRRHRRDAHRMDLAAPDGARRLHPRRPRRARLGAADRRRRDPGR